MKKNNLSAFTLIELVVSITVLSIIMISVFYIFVLSADLNNKTDISRSMQENVKNIVDFISEDVRKHVIEWVNMFWSPKCEIDTGKTFTSWDKLCIETPEGRHAYFLAKKDPNSGVIYRVNDYTVDCTMVDQCFLVFEDTDGVQTKLSNDWVHFRNIQFDVTGEKMKKVVIRFELQPSVHKWVKPHLIEETRLIFQTTLSGRIYKDY